MLINRRTALLGGLGAGKSLSEGLGIGLSGLSPFAIEDKKSNDQDPGNAATKGDPSLIQSL